MLTQAPLPKFRSILLAFFSLKSNISETILSPWVKQGEVAGWFSRSSWSLAQISQWKATYTRNKVVYIWLPEYFCNSALAPLRELNVNLCFYPVTNSMEPDYEACREMRQTIQMDLFVLVHYFGRPISAASAKDFCSKNEAWLIEDATHVLRRAPGIGKYGDFIIFSPHKTISIPDGALLVVCPSGPAKLGSGLMNEFGEPNNWSRKLDTNIAFYSTKLHVIYWVFKRILQKIGVSGRSSNTLFIEPYPSLESSFTPNLIGPVMSLFSIKLLNQQILDMHNYARVRKRNLIHWQGIFEKLNPSINLAYESSSEDWAPYLAAFKLNPIDAEDEFNNLKSLSIPAITWPDLPPEVLENRDIYDVSYLLRHSYIFFPLHHTITDRDLNLLDLDLIQSFDQVKAFVRWDCLNIVVWNEYLNRVGKSNLLQSWEYGESKQNSEKWNVKRGVISINGEDVAVVQVLEKRLFNTIHIYRINRGPLFLKELGQDSLYAVHQAIQKELTGLLKGRLLFHAPELNLNSNSIMIASNFGYYFSKRKGWESIWLDLRKEQEELRKMLDSKWRNMLTYAERHDLSFELHTDSKNFDWILKKYEEVMSSRGFNGVPVDLYKDLKKQFDGTDKPIVVLKAFSGLELLAGICIVPHGKAATYLLGWNSTKGRQLKANQFLLWNAILYFKDQEYNWFDLGGIDEENTPGISSFKLGVNGKRYRLIGEYMCMKL